MNRHLCVDCVPQVCLEEAKESYAEAIVHEVPSNTVEDMDSNRDRVVAWVQAWLENAARK